jgi:predicted DNA-binding protein with PD1-like motif
MKLILQDKNYYVLRFDKDEEVFAGLTEFIKQQAIGACVFSAIGACNSVELAFFNAHIKNYRRKPFVDDYEIASLTGNASLKDGQPVIHAHGAFSSNEFSVIAGHVFKMVVSVTCEVFLTNLEGTMERKPNPDFDLDLLA